MFECSWPVLPLPVRNAVEARTEARAGGPADPSALVLAAPGTQQMAMRSCPGCGGSFERVAPAQKYCGEPCRIKRRNERACAYKRRRRAEAERAQTAAIVEQNRNEGYDNLSWSNGHAAT
jgi:hypothetical protein